ncbi:Oidioi.mRNA.OKI2018_I69.chr2.g4251.t1.cds [Oikopleura dioica]|uniref:Oidioi.mRNA.OKI2018_I69.chr2.g4251.t1.cds n=1 Tax=Oikopleura dioica TaxID=34765 RepID=A0ABN7T272_OIKDI|nr:Oidioi.mRNA.OKI2018_I69.chr2.g4251.t1.cds [Oikopleura dioica]
MYYKLKAMYSIKFLMISKSPVYWIAGNGPECEIILVENNPTVNIYRSVAQIPESSARSQEGFSLPSASYLEQFYQRAVERRRLNGI